MLPSLLLFWMEWLSIGGRGDHHKKLDRLYVNIKMMPIICTGDTIYKTEQLICNASQFLFRLYVNIKLFPIICRGDAMYKIAKLIVQCVGFYNFFLIFALFIMFQLLFMLEYIQDSVRRSLWHRIEKGDKNGTFCSMCIVFDFYCLPRDSYGEFLTHKSEYRSMVSNILKIIRYCQSAQTQRLWAMMLMMASLLTSPEGWN